MHLRLIVLSFLISLNLSVHAKQGITKYTLSSGNSSPVHYFVHDSIMYFSAQNGSLNSLDLWMMDGISPKIKGKGIDGGPFPYHYIAGGKGDSLFLLVHDIGLGSSAGLYAYDLVKDTLLLISQHTNPQIGGPILKDSADIFYCIPSSKGNEIYRYNITTDIVSLYANTGDTFVSYMHRADNIYYMYCTYKVGGNNTMNLHLFDTTTRTISQQPLVPASFSANRYPKLIKIGPDIYFSCQEMQFGEELYKYSGSGLPQRVTDIRQGTASSISDYYMEVYNNKVYFAAHDSKVRESLYEYNPTNGTTKLIHELKTTNPNENFEPQHFYVYNKRLYMSGDEQASLNVFLTQPFVYDGADTPIRMAVLSPPNTGIQNRKYPKFYTEYKGDLYFTSYDSLDNIEMFRFNDSVLRPIPPQYIFETPTGIFVDLYPNPTTDDAYMDVQLQQAQTMAIQVLDINGRAVYSKQAKLYSQGKHSIKLPMQQLPAGTYVYRINSAGGQLLYSGKLIKLL